MRDGVGGISPMWLVGIGNRGGGAGLWTVLNLKLFNVCLFQKRRDKINQRMKTLQKLVPNSSKVCSSIFGHFCVKSIVFSFSC